MTSDDGKWGTCSIRPKFRKTATMMTAKQANEKGRVFPPHHTKATIQNSPSLSPCLPLTSRMRFLGFALLATCWHQATCFQPASEPRRGKVESPISSSAEPSTNDENMENQSSVSRRRLFQNTASTCASLAVLANPFESKANAAAPITTIEADSFTAKAQRLLRPKPPKALRPKLNKDFAVLMMRSSYNALDQLDCVAMVRCFSLLLILIPQHKLLQMLTNSTQSPSAKLGPVSA